MEPTLTNHHVAVCDHQSGDVNRVPEVESVRRVPWWSIWWLPKNGGYPKFADKFADKFEKSWKIPSKIPSKMEDDWGYTHFRKPPYLHSVLLDSRADLVCSCGNRNNRMDSTTKIWRMSQTQLCQKWVIVPTLKFHGESSSFPFKWGAWWLPCQFGKKTWCYW